MTWCGTGLARAQGVEPLQEARFYEPLSHQRVLCTLCPHECRIEDGFPGACGVRVNHHGTLYTLVYDKLVCRQVDPIEKKPLFHFLPRSLTYSVATVGCNMRCSFCQNWQISQWPKHHLPHKLEWATDDDPELVCPQLRELGRAIPGERVTPRQIVDSALACGVSSIAYTYTEPTIFFELVQDAACLAREAGLKNLLVTNGFVNESPLRSLAGVVDAVNVDLKFFRDESYRRLSRVRLAPILDAIRLYHALGIWLEVTTLLIPGVNDSDEELARIATFLVGLGPEVPWHVSQFYPAYRMLDRPPTPLASLRRAREIGIQAGLRYVYEGNVPGEGGEHTFCHGCGVVLIQRYGDAVLSNQIRDHRCPKCGTGVDGVGMSEPA